MSTFSLSGNRRGREDRVTVTWTDGVLSGDANAVAMIERLAKALEGTIQGMWGGPYTTKDHLASPYSALPLMRQVFIAGTVKQTGKLPLLPPVPEGAIR